MHALKLHASSIKNVTKTKLTDESIESATKQNPNATTDSKVVDLLKPISFSLTLEAYCDCV